MSTVFYYPTKAGATTTVTLPDPAPLGLVGVPRFFSVQQVTDGGVRYAYSHGGPERVFDLSFLIEAKTTFDALLALIRTDLLGDVNTFEVDILGVSYTGCRFNAGSFEGLQTKYQDTVRGCYRYPITLQWTGA